MKNYSDSPLHQQIYQTMQSKSTTELLAIWEANDRTTWSGETFDVISNLLTKRLGELPAQKDAVYEDAEEAAEASDNEADTYHSPRNLFRITDWARNLSWIVLGVYIAATLLIVNHRLPTWFSQRFESNGPFGSPLIVEGALVATNLAAGIVFFVVLQAVAEFAYILMDVDENTRSQKD